MTHPRICEHEERNINLWIWSMSKELLDYNGHTPIEEGLTRSDFYTKKVVRYLNTKKPCGRCKKK